MLSFCIDDGTPLVPDNKSAEEVTVVSPSANRTQDDSAPPTQSYSPRDWNSPPYQAPTSYVPPGGSGPKRRVWPWIIGIVGALLLGIVGLGIVAAVVVPKMLSSNRNRQVYNANIQTDENSNIPLNANSDNANSDLNSNTANQNGNENLVNENANPSSVPTDEAEVLSTLTTLEHDWTAANINADKQALDRILADDFVGSGPDGKATGKAEYIKTIERDTVTQTWDFDELKLSLSGPRATLSGIVKYQLRDEELSFHFVDKFVWRDGRWQAVASEVRKI